MAKSLPTIQLLTARHDRSSFDCGEESLNLYLQRYARQNADRDLGLTFVAVENSGDPRVQGYYTLTGSSMASHLLPDEKLPRYPVATVLIARLAVDHHFHGRGLGEALLLDIFKNALRVTAYMAVFAIEVDALHEKAREFYQHYGFQSADDDPNHLYIALKTVRKLGLPT